MVGMLTYLEPKCSTARLLGSPNTEPFVTAQTLSGSDQHDVRSQTPVGCQSGGSLLVKVSEMPGAGLRVELYLSFPYHKTA
jgi:hypothetical protein